MKLDSKMFSATGTHTFLLSCEAVAIETKLQGHCSIMRVGGNVVFIIGEFKGRHLSILCLKMKLGSKMFSATSIMENGQDVALIISKFKGRCHGSSDSTIVKIQMQMAELTVQ